MPAGLSVSRKVAKGLPQRQRKQRGKAPLFYHGAVRCPRASIVPFSRRESRACFIGTRLVSDTLMSIDTMHLFVR